MYKHAGKVVLEDNLTALMNHEVIDNIARIFAKLLKNSKKIIQSPIYDQSYDSIRSCLVSNLYLIDDLIDSIDMIESSLSKIKYRISKDNDLCITVSISDTTNLSEIVKNEFKKILDPLTKESGIILKEIERIEHIKKDLLFLFFYHDEWGNTLYSDIALRKEQAFLVDDVEGFINFCKKRILGLNFNKSRNIVDDEISEMNHRLFERLDPEFYSKNIEYSKGMYSELNSRICTEILNCFLIIIRKMRHSCRTLQRRIKEIKSDERYNDVTFIEILKLVFNGFNSRDFDIPEPKQRICFIKVLRLLYDYKQDIEGHGTLLKFEDENDLHNHLEAYLTRVRKEEKLLITHEGKKARGHLDFQINHEICIELKINFEGYSSIDELIQNHLPQLKEYMADRDSKIGILLGFDLSKQSTPHATRENYFKPIVSKGGRSIKEDHDIAPIGIVAILMFGGERAIPSSL